MTNDNFKLIAQTARELRTEAAAYTLLDAYARSGCATYPPDSELFRELWPDEQVPGFVLTPYLHIHPATHTVAYAEIEPRTTHTPGPWYSLDNGGGAVYMDQTLIARAADSPHAQANARLIAAAPDLLKETESLKRDLAMAVSLLSDGEDIISGLEAEADNAGIDMEEAREWWQRVLRWLHPAAVTQEQA